MGSKKAPKAKAATAKSAYGGVESYNVSLDGFGGATAAKQGNQLVSNSFLAPGLQTAKNTAETGYNSGLSYLSADPTQRLADIGAGKNDFYNLLNEQLRQQTQQQQDSTQVAAGRRGLEGSSILGGYLAQTNRDANLQDLSNRIGALDYLDQKATNDVATNQGALGFLANMQAVPLQMANQNLQTGFSSMDQVSALNAQMQQQANLANQQAQIQANAQRSAMLGNLIASGAAIAAAPFTGGASLMALPATAGGMFSSKSAPMAANVGNVAPMGGYFASQMPNSMMYNSNPFVGKLVA